MTDRRAERLLRNGRRSRRLLVIRLSRIDQSVRKNQIRCSSRCTRKVGMHTCSQARLPAGAESKKHPQIPVAGVNSSTLQESPEASAREVKSFTLTRAKVEA